MLTHKKSEMVQPTNNKAMYRRATYLENNSIGDEGPY